jgi:hypothetical protein
MTNRLIIDYKVDQNILRAEGSKKVNIMIEMKQNSTSSAIQMERNYGVLERKER